MSNFYGYGIIVSNAINPETTEKLFALLQKAPEWWKICKEELEEYIADCPEKDYTSINAIPVKECLEVINRASDKEDFDTVAPILEGVIYEAEGINLSAVRDLWTNEEFLVVMPSYPWTFNKNERDMTTATLRDLVMKYLSIITNVAPNFGDYEWTE